LDERFYARAGLLFMGAFLGSLRGEEVPRVIRKYFIELNKDSMTRNKNPHCILPLYGNFKGEQGIPRCYLRRVVLITNSGLDMKRWIERAIRMEKDSKNRYLFSNERGTKETGGVYENYLYEKLERVQKEEDGIISSKAKVREIYGISRSFRRGSTTAATNAPNDQCNDADIARNNRWRKEDKSGTKQATLDMVQLYTDTLQSINADLKFSKCL
jgi:hypothetical protein